MSSSLEIRAILLLMAIFGFFQATFGRPHFFPGGGGHLGGLSGGGYFNFQKPGGFGGFGPYGGGLRGYGGGLGGLGGGFGGGLGGGFPPFGGRPFYGGGIGGPFFG